jgi:autotransporter-associated beta strand protein
LSQVTIKTRWLLRSLALISGAGTLVLAASQSAFAACVITQPSQFLFTCAENTITTTGFNVVAPGSTSAGNQTTFQTGVDVVINPGVVISGNGLFFDTTTASPEKITNNGAAINTSTAPTGIFGPFSRALYFINRGTGSISYVGNGSASSLKDFGLFISGNSVQVGTPETPIVPNYSGPSSIATGGVNIHGSRAASAYFSGGTITGGLQFGQSGHDQPAILSLTGHTTITVDPANFSNGIFTSGPVILTSDANIGDASHRVHRGIWSESFGSATTVNGVPISVTQGAGSSIFADRYGIYATSSDAPGILNVTTNGTISVKGGTGVLAATGVDFGGGNVNVSHNGTITTEFDGSEIGIYARALRAGNVAVSITGSISTSSEASSVGLAATATSGNITIDIAPGAIIKAGGIGILAGSNTGTVTINNLGTVSGANAANFIGTMNVGNGGTTGTIIGNVLDRGTLNFNRSDAVTYSGIISDTGRVQQNGSGVLTLSGINTYTGVTNVNAGTLSVNGSIASSSLTTVNAGGTLGGTGTVGNTTINGGTLAPGNSIGALAVQGNLVFTAAASYMVEVSPANADRTNVTGTATLGAATVKASFAAGTYVNKQYTILNATGGVSGTFNTLANTDLPANFKSSLSYDSNNAYLNLALNFIPPPGGLNANQQSVANAIVGFFNSNAGIPLVFGGLTPAGLTQISGEVATGTQQTTFDAMGLFMGLLTDPFIAGRGDPATAGASAPQFAEDSDAANAYAANGKLRSKSERDAYAAVYRKAPPLADPFIQRWSVWAAGYGGSQTTDGNAVLGSNNTRSSIGGVAVGADYRFSPYTIAGFALAGGATNFSVNGLGPGRSDLFQAGAFVRHNVGAAYLTGALAYGWQDITTDRTVTIAGTDLLRAQFNANAFSGRAEGGYRFLTPWIGGIGLTPYAAGQFVTFDLPAYAEQAIAGANTFALSYAAKSVTDTRSELGLRTDKSYPMQNGIFTLRGRAAWAHDFNTDRAITPTFQTLPGTAFVVNGAAPAHDAALVTASAEMKWLNGISLAGTFEGEFSDVTRSYAGKGVVRYAW